MVKSDSETSPAQKRRQRWGQNLGEALEAHPLTVREFHRELLKAGADVSIQAVYLWLAGDAAPTAENQGTIATVLGKPAQDLFPVGAVAP